MVGVLEWRPGPCQQRAPKVCSDDRRPEGTLCGVYRCSGSESHQSCRQQPDPLPHKQFSSYVLRSGRLPPVFSDHCSRFDACPLPDIALKAYIGRAPVGFEFGEQTCTPRTGRCVDAPCVAGCMYSMVCAPRHLRWQPTFRVGPAGSQTAARNIPTFFHSAGRPARMSAAEALASPSKSVEAGGNGAAADAELPKALVKRILKAGLAQWDAAAGGDGKRDFQINSVRFSWGCFALGVARDHLLFFSGSARRWPGPASTRLCELQDALLACSEAAKLFIHYLTSTANDACRDAKRQTLSADDVLTALDDLDFGELVEPLKAALEGGLRQSHAPRGPCLGPALSTRGKGVRTCSGPAVCCFRRAPSCRAAYRLDTKEKAKKRAESTKKRKAGGAPGGAPAAVCCFLNQGCMADVLPTLPCDRFTYATDEEGPAEAAGQQQPQAVPAADAAAPTAQHVAGGGAT